MLIQTSQHKLFLIRIAIFLFLTIVLFIPEYTIAQWSVLKNDPRPLSILNQRFTQAEWNASNFATPKEMEWFNEARYGMFITFGLSAYVNKDLSWPILYTRKAPDSGHGSYPDSVWTKWPSMFRLEKFDAKEWVRIAQDAGMKYIVVIAKHHDGFHLWDTEYSDFKITNTPFKRDYLKELADACHQAGMKFGIYYSQRDWHHPDYAPVDPSKIKEIADAPYYEALPGRKVTPGTSHQKYLAYQFNVVRELCTKYGKVDIFWFDAAYWGGMFTADMWDAERLTRMIRKLQPGIIINNRTGLPGDYDTPEQRVGTYQERPWESCMTLNGSWAYSPAPIKSASVLIRELLSSASGNGNVLLSWGAHWNGQFDVSQKQTLLEIGQWLKKYGNTYYGTKGGPWIPESNYGATHRDHKIFLYVYQWKNKKLSLPVIAENKILKASFVNLSEKISWKQNADSLIFTAPAIPDSIASIIELTTQEPVKTNFYLVDKSIFSDPAYGKRIKTCHIKATSWINNQIIIDLNQIENVTGLGFHQDNKGLEFSVSADGEHWENTTKVSNREISLTTFIAGAAIPGKEIRYIRLRTGSKLQQLGFDIYAK